MIGILCHSREKRIVEEFFQLFKTPWEFYRKNADYSVIISSINNVHIPQADLQIVFTSEKSTADIPLGIQPVSVNNLFIEFHGVYYPIYGNLSSFSRHSSLQMHIRNSNPAGQLEVQNGNTQFLNVSAGVITQSLSHRIIRIGYNLFHEIAFLLEGSQPVSCSLIPSLEIHIAVLRFLIVTSGIPVIECPPKPRGYAFMVALTHDVDFVKLKSHFFNKTLFGFIYRAVLGSVIDFFKKKKTLKQVLINWKSVLLLPFIYCGLYQDIWNKFQDYHMIENDWKSTFFVIPSKNNSGKNLNIAHVERRAARYDVNDIKNEIQFMEKSGFEIGVHGIDGWHDSIEGKKEINQILKAVNVDGKIGCRIHWLCFDKSSFQQLENAGFYYDSTIGYNDAVGFRAGTLQVFCPIQVTRLKELPIHLQDTALFYPKRMGLTFENAWKQCNTLISIASKLGGVLTVLWHMRSIAPERLWDGFYKRLLKYLQNQKARIKPARAVVEWFEKRRAFTFTNVYIDDKVIDIEIDCNDLSAISDFEIRIYDPVSVSTDSIYLEEYKTIPLKKRLHISRGKK